MADPKQSIPTITYEEVANANAQIAMVTSPASRRALRSTTGATSAASSPAEKLPAPALPGTKKSTKQILFAQIGDAEPLQQSTQPTTQATETALQPPQPQHNVCDWAQAIPCEFPALPLLNCQIYGCDRLVHHLCQGGWERRNSHPDTVARLCCRHHPNYKYKRAPDKNISPPRASPPREVFPTASPADSSITGAPVDIRKKQKKTSSASEAATAKQRRGKRHN